MPTRAAIHDSGYARIQELARPTASARGYDGSWAKYSRRFRKEHPLCAQCLSQGVSTASKVVDHVIPHRGNQRLFWDPANHQALCKPHHDAKTAREDGGFGNAARTKA